MSNKFWIEMINEDDLNRFMSVSGDLVNVYVGGLEIILSGVTRKTEEYVYDTHEIALEKAKEYMDAVEAWHSVKPSNNKHVSVKSNGENLTQNEFMDGLSVESPWQENTGKQPVEDDVMVEIERADYGRRIKVAGRLDWFIEGEPYSIIKWRLAK